MSSKACSSTEMPIFGKGAGEDTTDEEAGAYKKWECKRRLIKLCFTAWMHRVIIKDSEEFDSTDWGWEWVWEPLPTGGPPYNCELSENP